MVASANLLMGPLNLSATQISRCHIKLDPAMLSQGKATAHTAHDATSYTKIRKFHRLLVRLQPYELSFTRLIRKKEVEF